MEFLDIVLIVLVVIVAFTVVTTILGKIRESKENKHQRPRERSHERAREKSDPVPGFAPVSAPAVAPIDPPHQAAGGLHSTPQYATFLEIISAYEKAGYEVDIHSSGLDISGGEDEAASVIKDGQIFAEICIANRTNFNASHFAMYTIEDIALNFGDDLTDSLKELTITHYCHNDTLAIWTAWPGHYSVNDFRAFIQQGPSNPFLAEAKRVLDIAEPIMKGRQDYQIAATGVIPEDSFPKSTSLEQRPQSMATKFVIGFIAVIVAGLAIATLALPDMPDFSSSFASGRSFNYDTFRRIINHPHIEITGRVYQGRESTFGARVVSEIFTIDFEDGERQEFVAAIIAGNPRFFLLDVGELDHVPPPRAIARFTGSVLGYISTEPVEESLDRQQGTRSANQTQLTGVVTSVSADGILEDVNYLHVRIDSFEIPEAVFVADNDVYVSSTNDYSITFVEAFQTDVRSGTARATVAMIYYDYEALASHQANWPLTNHFVVYHGDRELRYWRGGYPADSDRGFLTTQRFQSGEVFHARRAVVIPQGVDVIRIVRYDQGFQMIFSHEMAVRQ